MSERENDNRAPAIVTAGEHLVLGVVFELLFWIGLFVLWLAFSGGVAGAIIALVGGGLLFFLYRAILKRSRNPVQRQASRDS